MKQSTRYANQIAKVENDEVALEGGQEERQDGRHVPTKEAKAGVQEGTGAGASEDGKPHRRERKRSSRSPKGHGLHAGQHKSVEVGGPGCSSRAMTRGGFSGITMIMKILDHLEELLITFLMGRRQSIIFVGRASLPRRDVEIPGFAGLAAVAECRAGPRSCASSCSSGWPSSARLRRAHRHPRRRRRLINRLERRGTAPNSSSSACSPGAVHRHRGDAGGAHFVWENGAHYAFFKVFGMKWAIFRRADHARPRMADLDRSQRDSARVVADVLPLPAGDLGFIRPASCRTTTTAMSTASRRRKRRRSTSIPTDGRQPPSARHDARWSARTGEADKPVEPTVAR